MKAPKEKDLSSKPPTQRLNMKKFRSQLPAGAKALLPKKPQPATAKECDVK
ncbi:MAG TPA: hypothetical protein VM901_10515 [Bdellovibrionota bacterium]|jgi:hypothetical protein|nr:hypothetical protein [Bdellovibrionota bacterium]